MIVIREEQMKVFEDVVMNRFYDRIHSDLKDLKSIDKESVNDGRLRQFIKETVARAFEHGLKTEKNIYSFILCTVKFGENFDVEKAYFSRIFEEHEGNEAIIGRHLKLASD